MDSEAHAGLAERTIPNLAKMAPKAVAPVAEAPASNLTLKLFVRGLEQDERQLLDGLVRVSMRRSPHLELLEEREAHHADIILVGTGSASAVKWAQSQTWLEAKTVIWIGSMDKVLPGHTVIRRPVQWSILPSMLARAMEHGPGSVHASSNAPLTTGQGSLTTAQEPLTSTSGLLSSSNTHLGAGASSAGPAAHAGHNRVLVVDDSLAIRNHLRSLLEPIGFAVSLADSVETAMQVMSQKSFDCVLMDVLMPGVDGYEGCRQIKATLRGGKSLPVVMLTSKSSPFDRIRGKMAGCDAYLTKPVDPAQLSVVLTQHLQH